MLNHTSVITVLHIIDEMCLIFCRTLFIQHMGLLLLQYKSLKVEIFYPYYYITRYGHFLSIIWSQKSIKIHKYVQIICV